MTNERITAAGAVFLAPRASVDYGQVEMLTNLLDNSVYIRVKGGYTLSSDGQLAMVGHIADRASLRRMGLAMLALSEVP